MAIIGGIDPEHICHAAHTLPMNGEMALNVFAPGAAEQRVTGEIGETAAVTIDRQPRDRAADFEIGSMYDELPYSQEVVGLAEEATFTYGHAPDSFRSRNSLRGQPVGAASTPFEDANRMAAFGVNNKAISQFRIALWAPRGDRVGRDRPDASRRCPDGPGIAEVCTRRAG